MCLVELEGKQCMSEDSYSDNQKTESCDRLPTVVEQRIPWKANSTLHACVLPSKFEKVMETI